MNGQSQLEAAQFIGISKSNITRWKDGTRAAPNFVVKVARAYDANVLQALVEAEFITEEEASLKEVTVGGLLLEDSTNEQLVQEMLDRLESTPADELASRRSTASTPGVHPAWQDDAVADHSEDEEEGDPGDYDA